MAIKKSELYTSLWKSCDELRGGMDASQYKDYVLVLLFVKYVSDKYAGDDDALIEVPKGGSFADIIALKGDKEIGDKINKIIAKLAEANDLKGIIDVADFNNEDKLGKGKEMQDRLSNLVAACIIVIDKENAADRDSIFIIDASKGFIKDGNKNRLREQDIHKIVDVFNKQLKIPKYSRLVTLEEIEKNEYNLNIPRYIDSQEAEDIQDIEAHLLGGIPNLDVDDLQRYWDVYPSLRSGLFAPGKREGYSELKIERDEIKQTIFNHSEFISYTEKIENIIKSWCDRHISLLKSLTREAKPKPVIYELSEAILAVFAQTNLIDKYDVYQHLMMYWSSTMKDDVYFIIEDGWRAEAYPILDNKGKPKKDEWDCDLIPKNLVIDRYFAADRAKIEQLEADKEAISRDKEEMEEEHSGEDGYLEEVKNDKGKITKGNVQARIKELQQDVRIQV